MSAKHDDTMALRGGSEFNAGQSLGLLPKGEKFRVENREIVTSAVEDEEPFIDCRNKRVRMTLGQESEWKSEDELRGVHACKDVDPRMDERCLHEDVISRMKRQTNEIRPDETIGAEFLKTVRLKSSLKGNEITLPVEELSNLEEKGVCGSGSYGKAKCYYNSRLRKDVVVKWAKQKGRNEDLDREASTLAKLCSENIVKLIALAEKDCLRGIELEHAGESLPKVWQRQRLTLNTEQKGQVMEQIVQGVLRGLCYLWGLKLIHCDLKPDNICVKFESDTELVPMVKLIDFGTCRGMYDQPPHTGITLEYLPPGYVCLYLRYQVEPGLGPPSMSRTADSFALGLVILFMHWGSHPMIEHFTRQCSSMRPGDRKSVQKLIGEMKVLPQNFLSCPVSLPLETLLPHLLSLDENQRFDPDQALRFMESKTCVEPSLAPSNPMTVSGFRMKDGSAAHPCAPADDEILK